MGRPSHINMTISVALLTFLYTNVLNIYYLFIPFIAVYPDWDHHRGYVKGKLGVRFPFKHRGFTHTLLFILINMLIINLLGFYFSNIGNGGIIEQAQQLFDYAFTTNLQDNIILFIFLHGHLLGDLITKRGIPYFYPFIKKDIAVPLFSTSEEPGKFGITTEMYFNFFFTVVNIACFSYIFMNLGVYLPIFHTFSETLHSFNTNTLSTLLILQTIFIIYLFWSDISKTVKHFKEFFSRIVKVVLMLGVGSLISGGLIFLLTNNAFQAYSEYIFYFNIAILAVFGFFGLHLTKKYLISISYTTSYLINSLYIIATSSLFFL